MKIYRFLLLSISSFRNHKVSGNEMRNIRSMCRDIEWWEVNEVQIPGNKIEPQWPLLDTLLYNHA